MAIDWGSLITAMATPFDERSRLDLDRSQALARRLVETGSEALVVTGTTGESPTLSEGEKIDLWSAVVDAVGARARGPRVPVLAGTSSYNTEESVHLSKAARNAGVDGLLLVAPYYNRPTQEGLYRHFRAIAEASDLPCMLYNIPSRTGVNVLPETVARLARDCPNIVAVKEASGGTDQPTAILADAAPGFRVYSGDDVLTLPVLAVGGHGIVSVASHVAGREIRAMCEAHRRGDVAEAGRIHRRLYPLFKVLFIAPNPTPLKAALAMVGFPIGGVRLPLVPVTEAESAQVARVLGRLGMLPVAEREEVAPTAQPV